MLQVYHPTMRYELNAADKAVLGMTSKDENMWGVNILQRLYKHPACMLHSPGAAPVLSHAHSTSCQTSSFSCLPRCTQDDATLLPCASAERARAS